MAIDPPYRFDPWQNLVGVHWSGAPSVGNYTFSIGSNASIHDPNIAGVVLSSVLYVFFVPGNYSVGAFPVLGGATNVEGGTFSMQEGYNLVMSALSNDGANSVSMSANLLKASDPYDIIPAGTCEIDLSSVTIIPVTSSPSWLSIWPTSFRIVAMQPYNWPPDGASNCTLEEITA